MLDEMYHVFERAHIWGRFGVEGEIGKAVASGLCPLQGILNVTHRISCVTWIGVLMSSGLGHDAGFLHTTIW